MTLTHHPVNFRWNRSTHWREISGKLKKRKKMQSSATQSRLVFARKNSYGCPVLQVHSPYRRLCCCEKWRSQCHWLLKYRQVKIKICCSSLKFSNCRRASGSGPRGKSQLWKMISVPRAIDRYKTCQNLATPPRPPVYFPWQRLLNSVPV